MAPRSYFCSVFLVFVGLSPLAARAGEKWMPIEPAQRTQQASTIEPGADAEALFWEVYVEDTRVGDEPSTVFDHYVRVKVFNERGVTSQSTVSIPYTSHTRIGDVRGRTIKADGTVIPLKSDAMFDRTIVKSGGLKINTLSFAMPAVEPGAILEYRYREVHSGALSHYLHLYFQRDIPVRSVTYYVKPLQIPDYEMRSITFHGGASRFTPAGGGFYMTTASDLRAFREEPFMPPKDQVKMWTLVYYSPIGRAEPQKFWKDYANDMYQGWKSSMKPTSEIKRAAQEAAGSGSGAEEKLRSIFDWCRAKIRNRSDEATGISEEDRDRVKENRNPADALKKGMGSGFDIDMVFGALCAASGFEVRIAALSDRSDVFFERSFQNGYFLRRYDVAVRVGEEWRLFNPGTPWTSFDRLRWQEEGVQALVCGPDEPTWVVTPMSEPEASRITRIADFNLDGEGALEGEVRVEYSGHRAAARRDEWLDVSAEKREQWLRDEVVESLATAEVTAVRFENGTNHGRPFECRYHVRVPDYAQRTGKRLLVQPAYFQRGSKPLFPESERFHPIYFAYAWSTLDSVRITIPEGWELESGDSPPPTRAGDVANYEATVGVSTSGRLLVWARAFEFGRGGRILFARDQYAGLKEIFDLVTAADDHPLTLRLATAAPK